MSTQLPLEEAGKQYLFSPFTAVRETREKGPHVMDHGKGARVWDRAGKEYLDGMGGIWCVNVGYGRESIAKAMADQAEKLCYYQSFRGMSNEPSIRLAERICNLVPMENPRVFFGNSGSDANDTQIKLVWYLNNLLGRPEKKKFIARINAYHGVTVATASLSGLANLQESFDVPLARFLHVKKPHHYWVAEPGMSEEQFSAHLAEDLEQKILAEGPDTIAAFIAEPIMGAGGVIVPPKGYFEAIVPILKKYDILFIADEVVCGFGRLGTWFGSHYFGLQPDLMTVAKGLTSAYAPMSATIISEKVWRVLYEEAGPKGLFNHGYTYTAHPVSAAAGVANLEIFEAEGLVEKAAKTGKYLQQRIREAVAEHPLVGEIRGTAMICGVELVADKAKKQAFDLSANVGGRAFNLLFEKGLITRAIGNTLAFSPPLVLSEGEVDELVEKLTAGLNTLADQLRSEGAWQR
ncbi:MAG: aminotransferase class III-fold pyridoxal phosphate-dependent enzyme [Candidatus Hydrogenedentes bacterium]|nr:aminotransferase class III-fold pyridoxal phosphate-dependent enzyme [Candidatus Hydrogenedentota bacterium]